jgi:hypothetical protein
MVVQCLQQKPIVCLHIFGYVDIQPLRGVGLPGDGYSGLSIGILGM